MNNANSHCAALFGGALVAAGVASSAEAQLELGSSFGFQDSSYIIINAGIYDYDRYYYYGSSYYDYDINTNDRAFFGVNPQQSPFPGVPDIEALPVSASAAVTIDIVNTPDVNPEGLPAGTVSFDGTLFSVSQSVQPRGDVLDQDGNPIPDFDYYPYGDEADAAVASEIFFIGQPDQAIVLEWDFGTGFVDVPGPPKETVNIRLREVIGFSPTNPIVPLTSDIFFFNEGGKSGGAVPGVPMGRTIFRIPSGLDLLLITSVFTGTFDTSADVNWCVVAASSVLSPYDIAPPYQALDQFDAAALPELLQSGDLNVDYAAPLGVLDIFDVLDGLHNIEIGLDGSPPALPPCVTP